MNKLLWWLRRCLQCWDETLELVDRDTLAFYEDKEDWDNLWDGLSGLLPLGPFTVESGVFPGLDSYVCRQDDEVLRKTGDQENEED